ncbi:MAG: flagellar basal body rod protein FlgC [Candidatus Sumerlaeia bacterium]|nr:flagellar basal body rod protein FlgC [Candidatus Sumerlaeia bacterium]
MSTFTAMDIAASGLAAQRTRMAVVASNLANIHSTRDPEGAGPYRRREVVVEAQPIGSFGDLLSRELGGPSDALQAALRGVEVAAIRADEAAPLEVYDPGHPEADENGVVRLPNISVMREMADMMAASRMYEANLATLRAARDMAQGALEIGRS